MSDEAFMLIQWSHLSASFTTYLLVVAYSSNPSTPYPHIRLNLHDQIMLIRYLKLLKVFGSSNANRITVHHNDKTYSLTAGFLTSITLLQIIHELEVTIYRSMLANLHDNEVTVDSADVGWIL